MKFSRRNFIKTGLIFVPAATLMVPLDRIEAGVVLPGPQRGLFAGISAAAAAALSDWVTRVQGQGSDVTIAGTRTAVGIFIDGCLTDATWTKLVRCGIYAGDGLAAISAPLKNTGGSATDTRVNFVSGDYAQATGLGGSTSTSKYIRTGLQFDSVLMGDQNIHMSFYIREGPDAGITMQNTVNGAAFCGLYIGSTTGGNDTLAAFWTKSDVAGGIAFTDTSPIGIGHYIASRTSSSAIAIYKNGTSKATDTTSGPARVSMEISFHCMNYMGSFVNPTARKFEFYSIGTGLSSTDATNLTNRYTTLRTALGR